MKTNSIKIFWNYIKFVSTFGTFNICCSHTYLIILIQIYAYSHPNSAIIVLGSNIYNEKCVGVLTFLLVLTPKLSHASQS